MGKSNRTKQELERALKEYAKQIFELNEFLDIPQNTKLEDKIAMHSPRWNSIVREACADVFYFAKKLTYDSELYKGLDFTERSKKEPEPIQSILVRCYGEVILTVAHRRFSNNDLSKGKAFIKKEFIKELETDLKESIKFSVYKEKNEKQRQGISGLSESSFELVNKYNKFREWYISYKGDKRPENEILIKFVQANCFLEKDYEKLKQKRKKLLKQLKNALQNSKVGVMLDTDLEIKDEDGKTTLFFETVRDIRVIEAKKAIAEKKLREQYLWESEERFKTICGMLDEYYKKKQKRKNADENYWSAVYTYYLLEKIDKKTKDTGRFTSIMEYLQSLDFIYKDLIDKYLKEGSVQKQKDIAEKFGKDKTQFSRDKKTVEKNLKESLKNL